MDGPLISVILPIYNIENYLTRCMDSMFRQTYKNLELIMVDDGSTDNCPSLCDAYGLKDSRVRVFHKPNGGLSDARNYGIERAQGEYITCVDPDDYVDDDYVEYLYGLIERMPSHMSICQHVTHYDSGRIADHGGEGEELMPVQICLDRMLYHDVIDTSAWAKLYHRSLFETVRYPKGRIFEDIGTTYALMMQCREGIAVGYESKYHYMFHKNSIVNSAFSPRTFDLLAMTDRMGKDVLKAYPVLHQAVLRRRVYSRFSTLNQMLHTKDYEKERQRILRFLMRHSEEILQDPRAPRRDKLALRLLQTGYPAYKAAWGMYERTIFR